MWVTMTIGKELMLKISKLFALAFLTSCCLYILPARAATSLPFTVNLSKAVNVTGTPRIAIDVGGVTRYATYTSGTGTSALTFTYEAVVGDVDLDGITIIQDVPTSTYLLDLNGGTVKDLSGNNLSPLTFTPPATSNIKVNYPSLSMDFTSGRYTLNANVYNDLTSFLSAAGGTLTRASTGTYFDSSGILQTAATNTPRFDYDPVTHSAKGLLIEESRTNLLLNSDAFNSWVPTNTTITANTVVAPDGTTTADTWTRNSTANSYVGQTLTKTTTSLAYTLSVYAKKNIGNYIAVRIQGAYPSFAGLVANLNTGTISSAAATSSAFSAASGTIQNVGNGWYRITLTATSDTDISIRTYISFNSGGGTLDAVDTASNSSGYLWGAQLEQAPFATSYISTTSAAMTRAGEVFSIPTGSWYGASNGAVLTQYNIPYMGGIGYPGAVVMNDGTPNNGITLYVADAASDFRRGQIKSGGAISFDQYTSGSYTAGASTKSALTYATNSANLAVDGTISTVDTSVIVPSITTMRPGGTNNSITSVLNGRLEKLKYYPLRASDTQLQLLTQ